MVDMIITGMVAVVMVAICCCYLKYEQIKEDKNILGVMPKDIIQAVFGIGMITATIIVFIVLFYIYNASWVFAVKRIIVCTSLWPIALVDYRKHIIPNKVLGYLLSVRFVIALCELIYDFKTAKIELFSGCFACVGIIILLCLMRLIVKEGIGFGDIKLFATMGLFFGVKGAMSFIFMSFVVSFFVSIYMIISKRKNKKDQIAFAPSILVGTLLSVILLGA